MKIYGKKIPKTSVLWLLPYLYLISMSYGLGFWGPFTINAFDYYQVTDLLKGAIGSIIPAFATSVLIVLWFGLTAFRYDYLLSKRDIPSKEHRVIMGSTAIIVVLIIIVLQECFGLRTINLGLGLHMPYDGIKLIIWNLLWIISLLLTVVMIYFIIFLPLLRKQLPALESPRALLDKGETTKPQEEEADKNSAVETSATAGEAPPTAIRIATAGAAEISKTSITPKAATVKDIILQAIKIGVILFFIFLPPRAFLVGKETALLILNDIEFNYVAVDSLLVPQKQLYKFLGKAGDTYILLTMDNRRRIFLPTNKLTPLVLDRYVDKYSDRNRYFRFREYKRLLNAGASPDRINAFLLQPDSLMRKRMQPDTAKKKTGLIPKTIPKRDSAGT